MLTDAITWMPAVSLAAMSMKAAYDSGHKLMFFDVFKHIVFQEQQSGPFTILECICKLTPSMKIRDILLVVQLEPVPYPALNPYEDLQGRHLKSLTRGQSKRVKYLVRWKNCNVEHDTWKSRENLKNAMERVQAFEENEVL